MTTSAALERQAELEIATINHGTYGGAQKHRRLGSKPCRPCLDAQATYIRMWRQLKPQCGPRCRCRPCLKQRAQLRAAKAAERAAARAAAAAARPAHGYGPYSRGVCRCRVCKDAEATYVRNKRATARQDVAA